MKNHNSKFSRDMSDMIPLPLHNDKELERRLIVAFNKNDVDSIQQIKTVLADRGVYFTVDCYA